MQIPNRYVSAVLPCISLFLATLFLPTGLNAEEAKDSDKKGLTVFITGANRGLGLEFATQFSANGYTVIGTTRKPEEATELKATGVEIMKLDVTSDEDIAAVSEALNGRKIDILINNAGYFGPKLMNEEGVADITNVTRQEMIDCFNVNTIGPILVTQALLPNLKLSDSPKVINISTRSSILSRGAGRAWGYSVSKTGLNMVTRNMHGNLSKQGFIVISLAPGHNKTDMGTERGNLMPEESIGKMIPIIETLTLKQSGGFWYYDGSQLPW
ncbi:MAG: SDR family oxidoreductase [Luteolibacter sp.]